VASFDDDDGWRRKPSTSLDVDLNGGLSIEKIGSWSDDSLHAALRRRINDLEQIEEHLRRQVYAVTVTGHLSSFILI